eukprot:CAMPEP_0113313868 /NCGR_PEP_ID=MMETSP0010_2-20120614/10130_1 /TAXON_ID=216773 ORGANISM="Corethron hystrix, Strain 308" /NCGR_SAMPLE_ID=MMETSP0010_2 /ASSEMBLY_ACC=CAM_ASM_000155 /LENGTH=207 /DNA_ID=CAMNT_0000169987 /DNA_START=167 /DNA_END=790 /DNA_ORIENTATION=- /assembly_acc=CAM_ASM_000155
MPTSQPVDSRRVVGGKIQAKTDYVTSLAEATRWHGSLAKTKKVDGVVLDVAQERPAFKRVGPTYIVGEYNLGKCLKIIKLRIRSVYKVTETTSSQTEEEASPLQTQTQQQPPAPADPTVVDVRRTRAAADAIRIRATADATITSTAADATRPRTVDARRTRATADATRSCTVDARTTRVSPRRSTCTYVKARGFQRNCSVGTNEISP